MNDWLTSLWGTDGFNPRKSCGTGWTAEWVAVHTLSDVLIWLAYLSIPLVLLAVARHRAVRPFRWLVVLFAAFIVSCGFVHLIEAIIFEHPIYRLSGVVKGVTAVVSWATVFALVPTLRKVLPLLDALPTAPPAGSATGPVADPDAARQPALVYSLAVLVGLLAVLVRYALDPALGDLPAFGVSILAVTFIAWYGGFGPGLVTLLVSTVLYAYLFLTPRHTLLVQGLDQQISLGLFVMTGLGVMVLGELQRRTRGRLHAKMAQLRAATSALATEKQRTDQALAQLDALVRHAPYMIAFYDDQLRLLRVNEALAAGTGLPVEAHFGKHLLEVRPDAPADTVAAFGDILAGGPPMIARPVAVRGGMFEVSAFRVPVDDDRMGLAVISQDVTERHRAAERVRESEEKFRAMADGISQLAWMARPDGHIFWYNRRWHEYTGTTPEEMDGWGWQTVHDPTVLPAVVERWNHSLATGTPFEMVFPLRGADGVFRPFLTRVNPSRDEGGSVLLWFGTNTDVSEQRRMEEQLRESEGRFRTLAEAMPQIVWTTRPDGYHEYFNARWYEYTGLTPERSIGWGWSGPLHPDDVERSKARWQESTDTGRPYEIEYRFRRHDGEYEWFLGRAVAVRDEAGRIVRWLGTCTGIDEQVKTAQALQASETRFRQLADAMPQIVYVNAADGRPEYINRRWVEYTGRADTAPETVAEVIHPDDLRPLGERWAKAQAAAAPMDAELRLRRAADGQYRWFLTRAVPVLTPDGRVEKWYGTSTDIDEQKRTAEELREAKRFNEEVLNSLPAQVTVIDADGRIVSVNRAWQQFGTEYGLDPAHPWEGTSYFDPVVADGPTRPSAELTAGIRSVLSGQRDQFDAEYLSAGGGGDRYFHMRANRFRGDGPVRMVVTHEEVTDRVRAEQQVREAASQLAQLTEGVPLLMWACSPAGECDYLSRQWLDYTGRGLGEQLGYGWLDALHPEDRQPTAAAWQRAVADGGGYDVEFRIRRHDGAYRWFAVRGIPLRDQGGRVVRWFGSCTDVDDRVQQEELLGRLVEERTLALTEQKIFLNAILDSVAEGVVACDADGKLQLFNAATRRIHGLPAESLPPERWADHYQLFEGDGVTPMPTERVPLLRAWRGEVVADAELVVRATGQPERYLRCFGQQLRGDGGRVFGAVVSMRDMTDRREYERELVRTADALRASNQELEKFAYIASHDLQEPLRKIQAFGTRLATKFREAVGEQGKDYIDRMLDSAGRMRRLIEDLLAFSRVTTKGGTFEAVDLNAVARDVLNDLEDQLARSGGRVDVGPLPTVPGDLSQLRQVFQNLIGNALKFSRSDVPPVVTLTATPFADLPADAHLPPGPGWRIAVRDNGIGFDPQYADRIFELFQRLHGRADYEGTGLGLAIVRKIVLRHGATITAHSRPGHGAEFVLDWPARPAADSRHPS